MGGAQEPQVGRLGPAAQSERQDMVDLQQVPGAAPAPAVRVHVGAASLVALPHFSLDRYRNRPPARRTRLWRCGNDGCRSCGHLRRRSAGIFQRRGALRCHSGAAVEVRRLLRWRSGAFRVHGGPRARRSGGAVRGDPLLRRRSRFGVRRPTCGAPPAWRPGRVVAIEGFVHQPTHDLPDRKVISEFFKTFSLRRRRTTDDFDEQIDGAHAGGSHKRAGFAAFQKTRKQDTGREPPRDICLRSGCPIRSRSRPRRRSAPSRSWRRRCAPRVPVPCR